MCFNCNLSLPGDWKIKPLKPFCKVLTNTKNKRHKEGKEDLISYCEVTAKRKLNWQNFWEKVHLEFQDKKEADREEIVQKELKELETEEDEAWWKDLEDQEMDKIRKENPEIFDFRSEKKKREIRLNKETGPCLICRMTMKESTKRTTKTAKEPCYCSECGRSWGSFDCSFGSKQVRKIFLCDHHHQMLFPCLNETEDERRQQLKAQLEKQELSGDKIFNTEEPGFNVHNVESKTFLPSLAKNLNYDSICTNFILNGPLVSTMIKNAPLQQQLSSLEVAKIMQKRSWIRSNTDFIEKVLPVLKEQVEKTTKERGFKLKRKSLILERSLIKKIQTIEKRYMLRASKAVPKNGPRKPLASLNDENSRVYENRRVKRRRITATR